MIEFECEDPEPSYGEMAVCCVLRGRPWTHLRWPAYEEMAHKLADRGEIERTQSLGRAVFRLIQKESSDG